MANIPGPPATGVNLRIGEVPNTTDPQIFPDMLDIYNALHILAQYTDAQISNLHDTTQSAIDTVNQSLQNLSNQINVDNLAQFGKFYITTVAAQAISAGQVCHVYPGGAIQGMNSGVLTPVFTTNQGSYPGDPWGNIQYPNRPSISEAFAGVFGIALNSVGGGGLVKIGIGPCEVSLNGVSPGMDLWAAGGYESNVYSQGSWDTVGAVYTYRNANDGGIYQGLADYWPPGYAQAWGRNYARIGVGTYTNKFLLYPPGTDRGSVVYRVTQVIG